MDRCRCEEYAAAVSNLKLYTVGTLMPDTIDNYDRSKYGVIWMKHGVDVEDLKFVKPKAFKIRGDNKTSKTPLALERSRLEQMWCPYLINVRK